MASKDFNVIALSDFQLLGFCITRHKRSVGWNFVRICSEYYFYAALMAGEIIGFNMGLGFSQFLIYGWTVNIIYEIFYLIALLIFVN